MIAGGHLGANGDLGSEFSRTHDFLFVHRTENQPEQKIAFFVRVLRGGRGGRNAEFALALAAALDGMDGVWAIAGDTDGIDGTEDNAGAVVTPDVLARARSLGIDAADRLADNDGYGFFAALGDLVVTGPTHTNVNDFRAIVVV